jgi:hypothetical protein
VTADEALPWLFLVLAAGTFLVGAFLLVSGRQAKAAGEESNKIKFFNIEIESSTSGTTLIILSILATVLIISLGIAPAADDDNDGTTNVSGVDDPTTPTDPTTTPTDPTDPPDDNPSGLEADRHLLSAGDVADASQGYGFTGWQTVDSQDRPVLDCLERVTKNLPGFVLKAVKRNFQGQTSLGYDADAMTSAARYESPGAAQANFQTVSGWLQSCPGGVSGSTSLDPNQAGSVQTGSSFAWRNFWTSPSSAPCAGSCIWVDSQGVGLVDDRLVLFSVRWYQEDPFTGTEGPIPDLLPEAMEEAEE